MKGTIKRFLSFWMMGAVMMSAAACSGDRSAAASSVIHSDTSSPDNGNNGYPETSDAMFFTEGWTASERTNAATDHGYLICKENGYPGGLVQDQRESMSWTIGDLSPMAVYTDPEEYRAVTEAYRHKSQYYMSPQDFVSHVPNTRILKNGRSYFQNYSLSEILDPIWVKNPRLRNPFTRTYQLEELVNELKLTKLEWESETKDGEELSYLRYRVGTTMQDYLTRFPCECIRNNSAFDSEFGQFLCIYPLEDGGYFLVGFVQHAIQHADHWEGLLPQTKKSALTPFVAEYMLVVDHPKLTKSELVACQTRSEVLKTDGGLKRLLSADPDALSGEACLFTKDKRLVGPRSTYHWADGRIWQITYTNDGESDARVLVLDHVHSVGGVYLCLIG